MSVSMNEVTASQEEETWYFDSLEQLLPANHRLAFYLLPDRGILALLSTDQQGRAHLKKAQQFAPSEVSLLQPLLSHYPYYCPHDVLFASFYQNAVIEEAVAQAQLRLQHAIEHGTWDQEMRPLRNVLSRTRLKLKDFGLDVLSILETGYLLLPYKTKNTSKRL